MALTSRTAAPPGVDLARLEAYLAEPLALHAPLTAELLHGGKSNLTYLLRSGDAAWILRRPPAGERLPTAHSMRREHTVLRALSRSAVPVPRVVVTCEDEAVLGAPFYVMDRVEGRVIRAPADADLTPDEARRCSLALIGALADLHTVPYAEAGLADFGRPDGFVRRQVERWDEQLRRGRSRALPELDELGRLLRARVPEAGGGAAIVHGDFRIDNVMLDPADPGRVVAVLDWEMATIGDPLADLGMLLMYWGRPGEDHASPVHAITAAPGFLERDELATEYERRVGRPLGDLAFHVAFAHYKLAVIVEGIVTRHRAGATVGEGFDALDEIPPRLAAAGLQEVTR